MPQRAEDPYLGDLVYARVHSQGLILYTKMKHSDTYPIQNILLTPEAVTKLVLLKENGEESADLGDGVFASRKSTSIAITYDDQAIYIIPPTYEALIKYLEGL